MGKIKIVLFYGFLCLASTIGAQEQLLHGNITNDKEVEGIHIMNKTTQYNSVTDENGNFSIIVNKQDTIYISSVNYVPDRIVISEEIYEKGLLIITLEELVNQLDEVYLGPNLTGNIVTDLKNIKTEKPLNFDDVGIEGFKGEPEEKIVPMVPYVGLATAVDLEAMYKHLSGYFRKLRLKREWEGENRIVAQIINKYTDRFFEEAFHIPNNRLYDFLLFCIETTDLKKDFENENYALVLQIFQEQGEIYVERFSEKEE
ncbi:carboxypeptidase-like protein [Ulvibacter sp. MAR_2010_11]|uniref:carboxypeptidase-like regulatory domain-containing protein n=1 Tax=Ulvibacter sp. MAR_2010_11 TaxID=1250229 RepID=UPI000C2CCD69|nr:carboxypeptidase-like regulatory domain-containing protein [Ulvibacter sp. MAR_2010_11]PKA82293.1 carboxypeptidase-like protein [Ulvibacter sp. MAR_2010_11]